MAGAPPVHSWTWPHSDGRLLDIGGKKRTPVADARTTVRHARPHRAFHRMFALWRLERSHRCLCVLARLDLHRLDERIGPAEAVGEEPIELDIFLTNEATL